MDMGKKVPVINADTGEKVGEASANEMIGAHTVLRSPGVPGTNFYPILELGGVKYSAAAYDDHIEIMPSSPPWC